MTPLVIAHGSWARFLLRRDLSCCSGWNDGIGFERVGGNRTPVYEVEAESRSGSQPRFTGRTRATVEVFLVCSLVWRHPAARTLWWGGQSDRSFGLGESAPRFSGGLAPAHRGRCRRGLRARHLFLLRCWIFPLQAHGQP